MANKHRVLGFGRVLAFGVSRDLARGAYITRHARNSCNSDARSRVVDICAFHPAAFS
jgi:hypothetical protein